MAVLQRSTLSIFQKVYIAFRIFPNYSNKKLPRLDSTCGLHPWGSVPPKGPSREMPSSLLWGLQRSFPMLFPLTPLTWAWPGALAPSGLFQQDFSPLLLLSLSGTRLQPCPAQRQKFQFLVTKTCWEQCQPSRSV